MPVPLVIPAVIVTAIVSSVGTYFIMRPDAEALKEFTSELLDIINNNMVEILEKLEASNSKNFKAIVMMVCEKDIENLVKKHSFDMSDFPWAKMFEACEPMVDMAMKIWNTVQSKHKT